ncbi:hypothetical protein YB2330_004186 [Saitoella coloradoensis]
MDPSLSYHQASVLSTPPRPSPGQHLPPSLILLKDTQTQSTRPPRRIHYIFSDDPVPSIPPFSKAVMIDMDHENKVVSAMSMSEDWQVVGTEVAKSTNWFGEQQEDGGVMVTIQGTGVEGGIRKGDDIFEMARKFTERNATLRSMIDLSAGKEKEVEHKVL